MKIIFDMFTLTPCSTLRAYGGGRAVYSCMKATSDMLVVGTSLGLTVWDFNSFSPGTLLMQN